MRRVVINSCHGGFGLSHDAMLRFAEIKEIDIYPEKGKWDMWTYWLLPENKRVKSKSNDEFYEMSIPERQAYNALCEAQTLYDRDILRDDPALVQVVEEMGKEAASRHDNLNVIEIPDNVEWQIEEYDGMEHVAEKHRTWS